MKESVIKNMKEVREDISGLNIQLFTTFTLSSMISTSCSLLSLYLYLHKRPTECIAAAVFSGVTSFSSMMSVVGIFNGANQYHTELCNFLENNDHIPDEECPLLQIN